MSIIEAGPDFEKQIPQTGITFIFLSTNSKCGACVKQKEIYKDILSTYPEITLINIDIQTYPIVGSKYGVSSTCNMVYNNGVFLKRFMQGMIDYTLLKETINKIKNNQPINDSKLPTPIKVDVKKLQMTSIEFNDWFESEQGQNILKRLNTRILTKNNDNYEIIYLDTSQMPPHPMMPPPFMKSSDRPQMPPHPMPPPFMRSSDKPMKQ